MRSVRFLLISALLCSVLIPASAMGGGEEQPVSGLVHNMVQQPQPAADFTLTDQNGLPFHMADQKGKVVLMCFIYTHCTDICPFIAAKVKDIHQLLGPDAGNVVLVAVTTDPKRDVPAVTLPYSKALGLNDVWHFVGGSAKAVQAVWASYAIGVTVNPETDAVAPPKEEKGAMVMDKPPTQGLSSDDLTLVGQIVQQFGGGYDVGHSAPFWIVDKKGMVRVGMDADAAPADVVTNLRVLLKLK
ncbi:MAG TPA: SCO family protein [Spirochaetia bacterium]|nr:SCO family protein [Spirochaetia bacterium]